MSLYDIFKNHRLVSHRFDGENFDFALNVGPHLMSKKGIGVRIVAMHPSSVEAQRGFNPL